MLDKNYEHLKKNQSLILNLGIMTKKFYFWQFDIWKFELNVGQNLETSQKESKFATKFTYSDP